LKDIGTDWEKKILFLSDVHFDSPWCDRKLLKSHLEEAVKEDGIILCAGDLFDVMQGPKDPRSDYRELMAKYKTSAYFDDVLNDAFDFLRPYIKNFAVLGYGNHEYGVLHHNGTDLIQRLVEKMRKEGSQVVAGGYGGFIRIAGYRNKLDTPYMNYRIYYNHGTGGEAPVTQGAIQTNRQAVWVRDCDLIWNGHNHKSYIMDQATLGINNKDEISQNIVYFIRTPGYKNEMQVPAHGFAASRNMAPTPRGCIWATLKAGVERFTVRYTQDIE
jgi:predicted phosphodiesterase